MSLSELIRFPSDVTEPVDPNLRPALMTNPPDNDMQAIIFPDKPSEKLSKGGSEEIKLKTVACF